MTLDEFKQLLLTADPNATHYYSVSQDNYTVWREYGDDGLPADDELTETVWNVQVDRYTRVEFDPIAKEILDTLRGHPDVSCHYEVDFEQDTKYIHHIYDCEVV